MNDLVTVLIYKKKYKIFDMPEKMLEIVHLFDHCTCHRMYSIALVTGCIPKMSILIFVPVLDTQSVWGYKQGFELSVPKIVKSIYVPLFNMYMDMFHFLKCIWICSII